MGQRTELSVLTLSFCSVFVLVTLFQEARTGLCVRDKGCRCQGIGFLFPTNIAPNFVKFFNYGNVRILNSVFPPFFYVCFIDDNPTSLVWNKNNDRKSQYTSFFNFFYCTKNEYIYKVLSSYVDLRNNYKIDF